MELTPAGEYGYYAMSDESEDSEYSVPVPKQQRVTQILLNARMEVDAEEKCDKSLWYENVTAT